MPGALTVVIVLAGVAMAVLGFLGTLMVLFATMGSGRNDGYRRHT